MKWPKGPFWTQPGSLDLIRGSSLNCLIIPWGRPENQSAAQPLLAEGARRGISFVGVLEEGADSSLAAQSAKTAGLAAMATSKPDAVGGFPAIPWAARAKMPHTKGSTALAFDGSVWPAVKLTMRGQNAGAEAGPTGVPWLDSNGWAVQMSRVLTPERPIWIVADPPEKRVISRPGAYFIAVADAAMAGGRWVVSLDDDFAGALAKNDAKATGDWKRITKAAAFFEGHAAWSKYSPIGLVGVLSSFVGDNEFLSNEALNLLGRRQLPFRVLDKTKLQASALQGLKAIVYTDDEMPTPAVRQMLATFTRAGGLLICPKKCAALAGDGRSMATENPLFEIHPMGTGRVAVSTEDSMDPFVLAGETHMMLSRRNDLYHLYSVGAATGFYSASPDGRHALLQVLNFSSATSPDVSVELARTYRTARFWTLEADAPVALELFKRETSQELHLPAFSQFCAIELEV